VVAAYELAEGCLHRPMSGDIASHFGQMPSGFAESAPV